MKTHRTALLAVLLSLAFGSQARAAGEYQSVEVASLTIAIDTEWALQGSPGYVPVRFDITNVGNRRVITILASGSRYTYGREGNLLIQQDLPLERGDRVQFTIPVPVFSESENTVFEVRENGKMLKRFNYVTFQSGRTIEDSAVIVVAEPAKATTWLRPVSAPGRYGYGSGGSPRALPRMDSAIDPTHLPTNWLGYTSLRAVVIGQQQLNELMEAQRSALMAFAASGGDLIVVDAAKADPGVAAVAGILATTDSGVRTERHLLGRIHHTTAETIDAKGLDTILDAVRDTTRLSAWTLPANRSPDWARIADRGFRLPIPGVQGVPVRSFLWVLLVFSILIGPGNYLLLWFKRQPTLFVLTVPAISALFIALIAGYAFLGEGLGVRARAETFTVLDQTTKQAATRASVSLYAAGMSPSGGLRFPRDLAVFPIGTDGRGIRGNEVVDLTESQQYSSGFVQARVPTNFEQAGVRTARERLTFGREGDRISVVNGLGGPAQRILYRDPGGTTYVSEGRLETGQKGFLKQGPAALLSENAGKNAQYPEKFVKAISEQPDNSYIAILEHSPFWEPGTAKIDERGSFHVVLGYGEGTP